jgi:hypothetical protein
VAAAPRLHDALRAHTKDDKVFGAGASYYGVSDLEALARDIHKFESRYLDWPIGPYPQDDLVDPDLDKRSRSTTDQSVFVYPEKIPRIRDAKRAARRKQILDAALVCFSEAGFHQTGMADIVRRSGLSHGAVYLYFPGFNATCSPVNISSFNNSFVSSPNGDGLILDLAYSPFRFSIQAGM